MTGWLAWATLLRSLAQLFPPLFNAVGRPSLSLLDSLLSAVTLSLCFVVGLHVWGVSAGIVVMGWAWLGAAVILLVLLLSLSRRVIALSVAQLLSGVLPGAGGLVLLTAIGLASGYLLGGLATWQQLIARTALLLGGYALYLHFVLGVRVRDVLGRTHSTHKP